MNRLYQTVFDQIHMPENRRRSMRAFLALQFTQKEAEASQRKKHLLHHPAAIAAAALLAVSLSVTVFAYGGRIVEKIHQLTSGGVIEQGVDENGLDYSAVRFRMSDDASPVRIREDGQIWLTVDEEVINITGQFSYTTPYIHDYTGTDGLRHVLVVGGETDAIGWSEYLWDEAGLPAGGVSHFASGEGREDAPWLDAAMDELALPW